MGWIAVARRELGAAHRLERNFDKARRQYRDALRIWNALGDKRAQAQILLQIGMSYEEQGKAKQACQQYEAGLVGAEAIADPQGVECFKGALDRLRVRVVVPENVDALGVGVV